ncbi:hypothetical protein WJT86_00755 [Microvirga sp. W0021]|uniref:Antifreeze protein n=1 Tax=Hohaiivirga grylli TaxID=3133970 RepID=A0ABV0BHI5_9HYPH
MSKYLVLTSAAACTLSALFMLGQVQPAQALTMKECSAKYQAAKDSGKLGTMKWNDFRAKECATDSTAATPAATDTRTTKTKAAAREDVEPPAPTKASPRGMTFPKAVSAKYASETAGKGRMHTCLDAYNDAKAKNTLNGMKWIEKGGGYYSFCNASLKGSN